MKEYELCVTWESCGTIKVEADSLEKAMNLFKKNPDKFALPEEPAFVDGSYRLSTENIEEMKVMIND